MLRCLQIDRINKDLDEIQSELHIAGKLITNFLKRAYTDKVIIGITFLIACGVLAIIIYSSVNKDQKIFNVPDVVQPPINEPAAP